MLGGGQASWVRWLLTGYERDTEEIMMLRTESALSSVHWLARDDVGSFSERDGVVRGLMMVTVFFVERIRPGHLQNQSRGSLLGSTTGSLLGSTTVACNTVHTLHTRPGGECDLVGILKSPGLFTGLRDRGVRRKAPHKLLPDKRDSASSAQAAGPAPSLSGANQRAPKGRPTRSPPP